MFIASPGFPWRYSRRPGEDANRRIDAHAHYWTGDHLDLTADLGNTDTATQRGLGADGGNDLCARLKLMDRARIEIDIQVLSAAPQMPYAADRQKALAARRVR